MHARHLHSHKAIKSPFPLGQLDTSSLFFDVRGGTPILRYETPQDQRRMVPLSR